MAFVAVPNAAKCVVRFSAPQGFWTNTFWFSRADYDDSHLDGLAALVGASWGVQIAAAISSQHAYVETVAYDMRTADGHIIQDSVGAAAGGDGATGPIPVSAAMVLTLYTANRGRSGRGRVYVTGFTESKWTTTGYEAASISAVEAAMTTMNLDAIAETWQPCVCSRQLNGVVRTTPLMQPITTFEVRSGREGNQRRRVHRG